MIARARKPPDPSMQASLFRPISRAASSIPRIYGQFAEHLGRGDLRRPVGRRRLTDSQHARLPQRRRRGAEGAGCARRALARRLLRRRIPLARRHRPARQAAGHGQHALGRCRRPTPSARTSSWTCRAARRRGLCQRQRRQRHAAGDGGLGRVHDLGHRLDAGQPAPHERPRQALEGAVLRRRQRDLGLRRQHAAGVLRRPLSPVRDLRQGAAGNRRSRRSRAARTTTTTNGPRC